MTCICSGVSAGLAKPLVINMYRKIDFLYIDTGICIESEINASNRPEAQVKYAVAAILFVANIKNNEIDAVVNVTTNIAKDVPCDHF